MGAPMTEAATHELVGTLRARTATGLVDEFSTLIDDGVLTLGSRLPTIRSVAESVGVSVGTVAEVWTVLRQRGMVETRRRGGTRVVGTSRSGRFGGWADVDFLLSSPDVSLQPPLENALLKGLRQPGVNAWGREYMVPALRDAVAPDWPFPASAWTSAGGGSEGLWLATRGAAVPGRPIAVEEPAPPGFLDLLAEWGCEVIGVPVDGQGPDPAALQHALDAGAAVFVHQPGGPYSPRHVLSEERATALIEVLRPTDAVVVEDDSLGPLSAVPVRSLGVGLPDRTVRVLSFCKSYGLDLRTSVIGGAQALVDRAIAVRSGGVASNSRILQHALAALLADPDAARTVTRARERYSHRRELAQTAFEGAGLTVRSGPGSLVLWVEVRDERSAALALATRGIVVDTGAASYVRPPAPGVLRFSTAQLPEDQLLLDELATLVRRSVSGDLRVMFD